MDKGRGKAGASLEKDAELKRFGPCEKPLGVLGRLLKQGQPSEHISRTKRCLTTNPSRRDQ